MSSTKGGRGAMTKTPITLQDLRRRLYVKAKAEPSWRFWGLYSHVCKRETLRVAYTLAKQNDGAPGTDGVTFEAIEADGVERFLDQLREELVQRCYQPQRPRKGREEDSAPSGARAPASRFPLEAGGVPHGCMGRSASSRSTAWPTDRVRPHSDSNGPITLAAKRC